MFHRTLYVLADLVWMRQIYSLILFLYSLPNIYFNFMSWDTCKFLRMDSERNNIVQNNNNNYSFIKKHFCLAPWLFCDSAQRHLCGCIQSSTWSIQRGRCGGRGKRREDGAWGEWILSLLLKVRHCPPRHQMSFFLMSLPLLLVS